MGSHALAQPAPIVDWQQPAASRLQLPAHVRILLLGEQHDAPEHQALQKETVLALAQARRLAAVVIEMAESGRHTRGLAATATEQEVQRALAWQDSWPWASYGPVVMAAVRAGIAVWGGNLPRSDMRSAMQDTSLDARIPAAAFLDQQTRIRQGHCNMLPESQIIPMTRIQLARDLAIAQAVSALATLDQQVVLLIAGNGHVRKDVGVPLFLPAALPRYVVLALPAPGPSESTSALPLSVADVVWQTPARAPKDYCADMKKQMGR